MNNSKALELYNKLYDKFLSPQWLDTYSFSEDFMRKHLLKDRSEERRVG